MVTLVCVSHQCCVVILCPSPMRMVIMLVHNVHLPYISPHICLLVALLVATNFIPSRPFVGVYSQTLLQLIITQGVRHIYTIDYNTPNIT